MTTRRIYAQLSSIATKGLAAALLLGLGWWVLTDAGGSARSPSAMGDQARVWKIPPRPGQPRTVLPLLTADPVPSQYDEEPVLLACGSDDLRLPAGLPETEPQRLDDAFVFRPQPIGMLSISVPAATADVEYQSLKEDLLAQISAWRETARPMQAGVGLGMPSY